MANQEQTQLYYTYKDYGVIPIVLPCSLMMMAIAVVGYFGNISIICATVKNKTLRSTCNVLLAISSFADSVTGIEHFIFGYFIVSGRNFSSILTCFYLQSIPLAAIMFSIQLPTVIAIDRFLCIALPSLYQRLNKKAYISFLLFLCAIYTIYTLNEIHTEGLSRSQFQVICLIVESMSKNTLASMFKYQISHNIVTTFFYIGIWLCIKFKSSGVSNVSTRVLKSLIVITAVMIVGWTLNAIVQTSIIGALKVSEESAFFIEVYFGLGPTSVMSANYFILYITSGEYRAIFQQQLNKIFKLCFRRNAIFPTGSTVRVSTRIKETRGIRNSSRE
ncbi:serpentine type 7TM GPCR chemoreceptor srsx domain-containing protein [Ditylenchus destructor]|uniref:Serpentine type 7TM GPCR chemoreceptor srsx domain-containing protein n=1 Tax=Ditylenchus destructor TaxID=166010 RepID=A0AAD4MK64_9BILA|nr:serpentine type 7TM GPCR chemoreceptor srsx domain-containing protein [Ditylenchus destructor]